MHVFKKYIMHDNELIYINSYKLIYIINNTNEVSFMW